MPDNTLALLPIEDISVKATLESFVRQLKDGGSELVIELEGVARRLARQAIHVAQVQDEEEREILLEEVRRNARLLLDVHRIKAAARSNEALNSAADTAIQFTFRAALAALV